MKLNLIISMILSLALQAHAARVEKVTYDASSATLIIEGFSRYWCNDSTYHLLYQSSGRAVFGPHHYKLEEIPENRMACGTEEPIKVLIPFEDANRFAPAEQEIVIYGEKDSSTTLLLPARQDPGTDDASVVPATKSP